MSGREGDEWLRDQTCASLGLPTAGAALSEVWSSWSLQLTHCGLSPHDWTMLWLLSPRGVAPTTASWDGLRHSLFDTGVSHYAVQAGLKPPVLLMAS
jgi:hypothetical protein